MPARYDSVNANQLRIPSHEWGTIEGIPDPNRDECANASDLLDIYDFKVSVKPDGGAEQVIDPQIEVDRDTLFVRRHLVVAVALTTALVFGLLGLFGGRWLRSRATNK